MTELHPGIYWTVWTAERKGDELERRDSYDAEQTAREFADELVNYHKHDRAQVTDHKGVVTYAITRKGKR